MPQGLLLYFCEILSNVSALPVPLLRQVFFEGISLQSELIFQEIRFSRILFEGKRLQSELIL